MRRFSALAALSLLLLASSPAWATDMEFYTYNGFDAVVSAFTKVALIFSDAEYVGLFYTMTVLGILIGGISAYMRALQTFQAPNLVGWLLPVLLGVALYTALIIPKGNLTVYDPVKNRFQTIGGIPDGLVVIAGVLNRIERGLVDIVSTAADPQSYQTQAGGVGFNMLLGLNNKGVLLLDPYMHTTIGKFINDCVFFEMQRPGTALTLDKLTKTADFMPVLQLGSSPSVYTTFYSTITPDGQTMSCDNAFLAMQAYLNDPANFGESISARCAENGFDPTIPAELTQCRTSLENLTGWLQGGAVSTNLLFRQTLLAQALNDAALSGSTDLAIRTIAARNLGNEGLTSGMLANDYIPLIRAVMTAIAISMVPFLALLLPTPFVRKAVIILIGFFVWLTLWGIIDATLHGFATDYGYAAFEEARQHQLGMTSILNFGTSSLKTLGILGKLRWAGLMLATVFTSALGFFGGHALGMLSGQITGSVQSAASGAARMATPEGMASALSSMEAAPAVMANARRFDFMTRSDVRSAKTIGETMGGADLIGNFGFEGAARMHGDASLSRTLSFGAGGSVAREMGLGNAYNVKQDASRYSFADTEATTAVFGGKEGYRQFQMDMKGKSAGEVAGWKQAFTEAKQTGFTGSWNDYWSFTAKAQASQGFGDAAGRQEAADRYWGGNQTLMQSHLGSLNYGQASSYLARMQEEGITTQNLAGFLGHMKAIDTGADVRWMNMTGEDGIMRTRFGERVNEDAKFQTLWAAAALKNYVNSDGQVDDASISRFLQDLHGTGIKFTNQDGIHTLSMSGGRGVYQEHQGAWDLKNPAHSALVAKIHESNPHFEARDGASFHISERGDGKLSFVDSVGGAVSKGYDLNTVRHGSDRQHLAIDSRTTDYSTTRSDGFTQHVGNDIQNSLETGTVSKGMQASYGGLFNDNKVNNSVRAYVNTMADYIGKQGSMAEIATEALRGSYGAGVSIGIQKLLGVGADADIRKTNEAISRTEANVPAAILNEKIGDIMKENRAATWKLEQATKEGKTLLDRVREPQGQSKADRVFGPVPSEPMESGTFGISP